MGGEQTTDKRRYRRVRIAAPVRFLVNQMVEAKGLVTSVSAGSMTINTKEHVRRGDHVVAYLYHVDRFEGYVARQVGRQFSIRLSLSDMKREKLIETLTLEMAREQGVVLPNMEIDEKRSALRRKSMATETLCTLENGLTIRCSVVDMSMTGIAIETQPVLSLHEVVQVGRMAAKVVRKIRNGYALEFVGEASPISTGKPAAAAASSAPAIDRPRPAVRRAVS